MLEKGPMSIAMKIPPAQYGHLLRHPQETHGCIRRKRLDLHRRRAPMNQETESFLRKIHFPITIGYGMTECAPLISFSPDNEFKQASCGRYLKDLLEVKIDSPDPGTCCRRDSRPRRARHEGVLQKRKSNRKGPRSRRMAPYGRHGNHGSRRYALHPRTLEDHDPPRETGRTSTPKRSRTN